MPTVRSVRTKKALVREAANGRGLGGDPRFHGRE